MTPKAALKLAIKEAGTAKALAGNIRVAPSTITYWLLKGQVPAEHAKAVAFAVNGMVTVHDLRPDVFEGNP